MQISSSLSQDKVCHNLRITSLQELITQLDESGQLPFAYDEREGSYKAVQATQVFTSPVKQKKEFDEEGGDNMDVCWMLYTIDSPEIPTPSWVGPIPGHRRASSIYLIYEI